MNDEASAAAKKAALLEKTGIAEALAERLDLSSYLSSLFQRTEANKAALVALS